MAVGCLAAMVANMVGWIALMIDRDELNLNASDNTFRPKVVASKAELLGAFEEQVAIGRRALASTTEEHLLKPWAFKINGQIVQQEPRHIMISDAVFSRLAHHLGQITVHLLLNQAA